MDDTDACRRVLVVDDEHDTQEAIAEVLADHDYRALAASNGHEALAQLHAMAEKPCVILLDLMMPVMNGFEFRSAQQADPALQGIPVIALSAHFEAAQVRELGVAAFVRKPFDFERLMDTVRATCLGGTDVQRSSSDLDLGAPWCRMAADPERWERTGIGAVEARGPALWAALPMCGHNYYCAPTLAEAQQQLDQRGGVCFACWYRTSAFQRALQRGRTTPPDGTALD